jgi:DNA-binding transcriptional LysR family regulator
MRDLNALATFVAVVKLNSFSLAADQCGISRALVTKHVQSLETLLGVKLLHRTTRRLALTQAGERFFERCVQILDQADDAIRDVEDEAQSPHGLIRVSSGMSFGRLHLLPAVADFMHANPDVRFDVTLSDQFADLLSGGTDLVVRMADAPRLSNLVARKLAPARYLLAASPAYLARAGMPRTPNELPRFNCIAYSAAGNSVWPLQGPDGVMEARVTSTIKANNADGILQATLSGLGIGILPSFAASRYLADGRLQAVLPEHRPPERSLYAMFLPERRLPQRVSAFVRFLGERFGPEPYWDRPG